MKVEGLATVQSEFGGVTIPREMFEEKKNATTYNYTKEFPPTLRDLVARVRNTHQTVSKSILLSRTECLSSTAWGFQVRLSANGGKAWTFVETRARGETHIY